MAPSTTSFFATTLLLACTATQALALPQGSSGVAASMPVLSATASSTQVWWTPSPVSQEWNAWSTAQITPSASSSVPFSNPFTIYTSLTNSLGVITGMPAVVTSQPSQAAVVTVCSGCASVLSAEASWSSMVASLYTSTTSATAQAASGNATASASASSSASARPSISQISGNAGVRKEVLGSGALVVMLGAIAAVL